MFSGIDLLETIIRNENIASDIYTIIGEKIEDEKIKEEILGLSKDEERHRKIYTAILEKFKKKENISISDENQSYIDIILRENLFSNKNLDRLELEKMISKYGIWEITERIERDAIFYILELQEFFPDLVTDEIKVILREERKHLAKVIGFKRNASR